jgi:hypothetical protein
MAYYDKSVDFTESASNQLLTDITYASPIGFRLLIDSQRYPNAQFSIQTASIPEITVDAAAYATPQRTVEIAGDKVSYSPFSCTFIVDEQLENYYEIHEWLIGLVIEPEARNIRKTRDMTLMVLNSHNNVSREIQFVDAYPTSLSTLDFDAKNTNVEYLVGDVTFNYSYFKVR